MNANSAATRFPPQEIADSLRGGRYSEAIDVLEKTMAAATEPQARARMARVLLAARALRDASLSREDREGPVDDLLRAIALLERDATATAGWQAIEGLKEVYKLPEDHLEVLRSELKRRQAIRDAERAEVFDRYEARLPEKENSTAAETGFEGDRRGEWKDVHDAIAIAIQETEDDLRPRLRAQKKKRNDLLDTTLRRILENLEKDDFVGAQKALQEIVQTIQSEDKLRGLERGLAEQLLAVVKSAVEARFNEKSPGDFPAALNAWTAWRAGQVPPRMTGLIQLLRDTHELLPPQVDNLDRLGKTITALDDRFNALPGALRNSLLEQIAPILTDRGAIGELDDHLGRLAALANLEPLLREEIGQQLAATYKAQLEVIQKSRNDATQTLSVQKHLRKSQLDKIEKELSEALERRRRADLLELYLPQFGQQAQPGSPSEADITAQIEEVKRKKAELLRLRGCFRDACNGGDLDAALASLKSADEANLCLDDDPSWDNDSWRADITSRRNVSRLLAEAKEELDEARQEFDKLKENAEQDAWEALATGVWARLRGALEKLDQHDALVGSPTADSDSQKLRDETGQTQDEVAGWVVEIYLASAATRQDAEALHRGRSLLDKWRGDSGWPAESAVVGKLASHQKTAQGLLDTLLAEIDRQLRTLEAAGYVAGHPDVFTEDAPRVRDRLARALDSLLDGPRRAVKPQIERWQAAKVSGDLRTAYEIETQLPNFILQHTVGLLGVPADLAQADSARACRIIDLLGTIEKAALPRAAEALEKLYRQEPRLAGQAQPSCQQRLVAEFNSLAQENQNLPRLEELASLKINTPEGDVRLLPDEQVNQLAELRRRLETPTSAVAPSQAPEAVEKLIGYLKEITEGMKGPRGILSAVNIKCGPLVDEVANQHDLATLPFEIGHQLHHLCDKVAKSERERESDPRSGLYLNIIKIQDGTAFAADELSK